MKSNVSNNSIIESIQKRTKNKNQLTISSSETTNQSMQASSLSQSSENATQVSSITTQTSIPKSQIVTIDTEYELEDICVEELISMAKRKVFPKKKYSFGEKNKSLTTVLHFFKSITTFNEDPKNEKINFECKICSKKIISGLHDKSNLYKHLNLHEQYKKWYEIYDKCSKTTAKPTIDDETLLLVKYFATSNTSYSNLENKYLRALLKDKINLPGSQSFHNTILPAVFKKLREAIQNKINNSESICL